MVTTTGKSNSGVMKTDRFKMKTIKYDGDHFVRRLT